MSDIEELRKEMEQITTNMLKLLKSRTDIAKEIGHLKNKQGLTVTDESREDELRSKMMLVCDKMGFDQSLATRFLNFLLNESDNIVVQNILALSLKNIGKRTEAIELFNSLIIDHPEVGYLYANLANIYLLDGKLNDALVFFEKAIKHVKFLYFLTAGRPPDGVLDSNMLTKCQ